MFPSNGHQNDISLCQQLQSEEYQVLASIYPDCVSSQLSEGSLKLEIPVEFSESQNVTISTGEVAASPESETRTLSLSVFPPLFLQLILPSLYPLHAPPRFLSIRSMHQWLPKISLLQNALNKLWQPGEGVLYTWVEYIRSGDFLRGLGLVPSLDHIIFTHPAPQLLAPLFSAYQALSKSTQFTNNSYPCSVCLTSIKGAKCLELRCGHIFCRSCLEDFWKMCIEEGDVGRVGCPDPDCVKEGREAVEEEVARIVTEAELQRWHWLRDKKMIDKDPSIIHCPMAFCQNPVPKPTDVDEESGWIRLRQCSACGVSFCAFCRRTWHGPILPCPIAHSEKVVLEYLAAAEGSAERVAVERLFGKTNVLKLVGKYQEEQANKQWLELSTMACPGCGCHVEKSLGCNHMTCWKCQQHFCYLCGEKLSPSDPYRHFSTKGLNCYYRLFDFTVPDA